MIGAFSDIGYGLLRWRLWVLLAWEEFRGRYHRTLIGPVWVTGSFFAFIAVKIFIFGALAGGDQNYFVGHVTLGYMLWTFLANGINGGAVAFLQARHWILGVKAPYSLYVFQALTSSFINLVLVSIAAFGLTLVFKPFDFEAFLYAMAGIALNIFVMFWLQLILAVVTVFVRDVAHLCATLMRIAFFLTPIIWLPSALGSRAAFVDFNPFTHLVAVVRAPILDGVVPQQSYIIVGYIGFGAMLMALLAFSLTRRVIPARI